MLYLETCCLPRSFSLLFSETYGHHCFKFTKDATTVPPLSVQLTHPCPISQHSSTAPLICYLRKQFLNLYVIFSFLCVKPQLLFVLWFSAELCHDVGNWRPDSWSSTGDVKYLWWMLSKDRLAFIECDTEDPCIFSLDIPHAVVVTLEERQAFIIPRQRFNGRVYAKEKKKKAFLLLGVFCKVI